MRRDNLVRAATFSHIYAFSYASPEENGSPCARLKRVAHLCHARFKMAKEGKQDCSNAAAGNKAAVKATVRREGHNAPRAGLTRQGKCLSAGSD